MATLTPKPQPRGSGEKQRQMSLRALVLGTTAVLLFIALLFVLLAFFLNDPLWAAIAVVLAIVIPLGLALVSSPGSKAIPRE